MQNIEYWLYTELLKYLTGNNKKTLSSYCPFILPSNNDLIVKLQELFSSLSM